MDAKWVHKIITIGTSRAVILPRKILSQLNWSKGEAVVISCTGSDQITIQSLSSYLQSLPENERQREIIKLR